MMDKNFGVKKTIYIYIYKILSLKELTCLTIFVVISKVIEILFLL